MVHMTTHDDALAETHGHAEAARPIAPRQEPSVTALGLSAGARLIGVALLAAALWACVYWALN